MYFMNIAKKFLTKINQKEFKIKLFFGIASIIYLIFSYWFFLRNFNGKNFFSQNFVYITYFAKNLERNFQEKGLEIKFENGTYLINKEEPVILENYDKRISLKKNLVYIAKDSTDKDFEEKDTLIIINSKELKIKFDQEPIPYPLETIQNVKNHINLQEIQKFNQDFQVGSELYNLVVLRFILILRVIEIFFLLFISNYVIKFIVYGILYLSGYKSLNPQNYQTSTMFFTAIYLIIKEPFSTFLFSPSFIAVVLFISIFSSIYEKSNLEKN